MEERLPRTELFKLPEELLELQGQCVNGFLGDIVSIPNDIVPQSCRKVVDITIFPTPCGGGRCTSYKVKDDTLGAYKLICQQTTLISEKMDPKNLSHLTIKQQIRGDGTYITEKIVLMNKKEFSEHLIKY